MRAPHFLRLAQIDDLRFITGCRHGLVHLTWERSTIRFSRDEFRRLAGLLERVTDTLGPSLARDGEMEVTYRPEAECEVRVGVVVLLLSAADYASLQDAIQEAVQRLAKILASGIWDQDEPEDAPPDLDEQLRRNPFSHN